MHETAWHIKVLYHSTKNQNVDQNYTFNKNEKKQKAIGLQFLAFLSYFKLIPFSFANQCSSAIAQLTRGRNREDKEGPELQSLAATALEKDYKQRAPHKLSLLSSVLKGLKVSP